jgi:hypothetical protein
MSSSRAVRTLLVAGVAAAVLAPVSAQAAGGAVGGTGGTYFLNDAFDGRANTVLEYGDTADEVYVADLDEYYGDSLLIRRGNTFFIRNSLSTGPAESTFAYGNPGDTVLVGDWDGDGTDSLAVRRGNTFYIKNSVTTGVADGVVQYGNPGDTVLVGDWNNDGVDTLAVRRGIQFFLKDDIATGVADRVIAYGNPSDTVLVGRWDGEHTSLGVRRGNTYYLANTLDSRVADVVFAYGNPSDTVLVGDWDGDGADTLGVRRERSAGRTLSFGETWYGDWFKLTASPFTTNSTGDGRFFIRTTLTLTNTSTVAIDPRNYMLDPQVNGASCGDNAPFNDDVPPGATVTVDSDCYPTASTGEFLLYNVFFAVGSNTTYPFYIVGRF